LKGGARLVAFTSLDRLVDGGTDDAQDLCAERQR
jgi:hypothetical protein